MFDGVDSGVDRVFNRLRAVSVSGHLATEFVGFGRNGLQLFKGILGVPGRSPLLKTPPEAQTLITSAPYFTTSRTLALACPRSVRHADFRIVKFIREKIVVTVASSYAERGPGHEHAGSFYISRVDTIA